MRASNVKLMPKQQNYGNQFFSARNLLFYLIFAIVVYGLVYFFFMEGSFKSAISYSVAKVIPPKSLTVALATVNNSGESGRVILTEKNGKTTVVLSLAGFKNSVSQPAHIHIGVCPGVGAIKYPLNNVINGKSSTVLPVSIAKLRSERPLAVNVHKSAAEVKTYVACGAI